MNKELIKWNAIKNQIEMATDIETLTALKDKLRAYQILAEQSKQSQEVQSRIAIYRARADRKCGEWLNTNLREPGNPLWLKGRTIGLKDAGINKSESHRLQKIADIPAERFENILLEAETETKKITNNMLIKIAKEGEKKVFEPQSFPKGKYGIIYADPPWNYQDQGCSGTMKDHYPGMELEKIKDLRDAKETSVKTIFAENSILFLWTTYPMLKEALAVIEAWGFEYKTIAFQWLKLNKNGKGYFYGLGRWTRGNTECCLLATKGEPKRKSASVFQIIEAPLTKHSKKPFETREKIIQLVGDLPKVELFAREKVPGWDTWGNEKL